MELRIPLTAKMEALLRERAAAEGVDPAALVLHLVQDELSGVDMPSDADRIAELRSWAASHARLSYEADDSRETIYQGRGE